MSHHFAELVVATTIALALRYDIFNYGEEKGYLQSLKCDTVAKSYFFVKHYQPCFHPAAFLRNEMRQSLEVFLCMKEIESDVILAGKVKVVETIKEETKAKCNSTIFPVENLVEEVVRIGMQLQERITDTYGRFCFFNANFKPMDLVVNQVREAGTRKEESLFADSVDIRAHCSLRELAKIEILRDMARQVCAFMNEVVLSFPIHLYTIELFSLYRTTHLG